MYSNAYGEQRAEEWQGKGASPGNSTSTMYPDGSGTVTFGMPRQAKSAQSWINVILSGSFTGISNVSHVIDLLLQLKGQQAA